MDKVLVSVICTNYNKRDWIARAIESFLGQEADFSYEILLVDDKSTDGSRAIIEKYEKERPDIIRAFYNEKNLGITKTWINICEEAKGQYIARCDGDDFWTDSEKLKKQIDALASAKDSLWCATDYDIVNAENEVTQRAAFESGITTRAASYAEMIATRGFTAPSTWVVDANLMREINHELDQMSVDDTFSIQLDLFNKTKLTYIPQAMAVYRVNDGSDSRPVDLEAIRKRSERLLDTQLAYVHKYKDVDYLDIIERLMRQSMYFELLSIERLQLIHQQWSEMEEQNEKIAERDRLIENIRNSKKYKIGEKIALPITTVKSIFKGRKNK